MSASLLKRALNLFDDLEKVKECQKSKKKARHTVDTNRWGIKKRKEQQFKQRTSRRKVVANEEKRTRAIIEELRREKATDKTEDNIKMFKKLSNGCQKIDIAQLHTRMHGSSSRGSEAEKSTVFTDEDFRRFEEEYHIS
ncbi:active regulator of SIRT1-like [Ornithodoros turicata]|uniref:active regulator of SIRT1-like n=1 Tax=Ornithodoros turicata TaxID=34597 RepID=UPI0031387641